MTTPVLSEKEMSALGFTDHREGFWYLCRPLMPSVTLNISINKVTGAWTEDVLNEDFLQPEYYMRMKPEMRDRIIMRIDRYCLELQDAGLNVYVDHSQYGSQV